VPRPPVSPGHRPYLVVVASPPTSGMAVASLIMGLLSVGGGFCLIIPPALAVVFGHIARGDTRDGYRGGNGLALTGLILGYLCLAAMAAVVVPLLLGAAGTDWSSVDQY
jgi:hypothetical protein